MVSTREEAITAFREYLQDKVETNDPLIIRELTRLTTRAKAGPLNLVCFCAPKPCHGDVIEAVPPRTYEKETRS
jgi:hypothetical protein